VARPPGGIKLIAGRAERDWMKSKKKEFLNLGLSLFNLSPRCESWAVNRIFFKGNGRERNPLFQTKLTGELLRGLNLYATLVMRPIHGPKRFLIPPPIFSSVLHSPQEVGRRSVSGGTALGRAQNDEKERGMCYAGPRHRNT